ncbi:MAG: esterase-like activity of phytase family protein [Mesorhizobium sp.]
MKLRPAAVALALLSIAIASSAVPQATVQTMEVRARAISSFRFASAETTFGPLEFVGGLEMTSSGRHFGSFSAMRFRKPGSDFIGVSDTGFWFFGRVVRDSEGKPSGIADFTMQEMVDRSGRATGDKWNSDAEGLAIREDTATASFERNHRISQYRIEPGAMGAPLRDLDFLVPSRELRQNRGFETVAWSDPAGPHQGALVAVTEKSLDADGNIFAAIMGGPHKGVFKVRRRGEFDVTDGAFLPNGDLLLLERAYSMSRGVAMRLRRIEAATIRKGALADGPILLEANMLYQIDNMEAMDVWRRDDGALIVSVMSDDNHSILQRNLYLEFKLLEE